MSSDDQYSPSRIVDRMQIQDVLTRWCHGIDRLDMDTIRDVFHPDAKDNHGVGIFNVDGLLDWIRDRHKLVEVSMHRVSNVLIEFAGPDVALVESYSDVHQCYPPGGQGALAQLANGVQGDSNTGKVFLGGGRYVDRFERRSGCWKIAARTVIFESSLVLDLPEGGPRISSTGVKGRRNKQDFVFDQRVALGLASTRG